MPTMPAKTDDELKRIIGSLNADYALRIQCPDPLLTPRKRRQLLQTDEERRNDALYHKLRVLHFQPGEPLSSCLGRFRIESRELLHQLNADLTFAISATDRAALQICLLRILSEPSLPPRPRSAKRTSNEFSDLQAKRPKSRNGSADSAQDDAVDSIPVRSSSQAQPHFTSSTSYPEPRSTFSTRNPDKTQSTGSSRTSSASRGLLSTDGGGPSSSQTSFAATASQDHYPLGTQEHQALDESFSTLEKSAESGLSTEICLPYVDARAQTLEKRLEDVWRK